MMANLYDPTVWTNYFQATATTGSIAANKNRTLGGMIAFGHPGKARGIRFYSARTGVHTVRVCLWAPGDASASPSRQVDVPCNGPGVYDGLFSSPLVVTDEFIAAQVYNIVADTFNLGLYDPSETEYTYSADADRPLIAGQGTPGRGLIMPAGILGSKSTLTGVNHPDTAGPGVVIADPLFLPDQENDQEPTPHVWAFGKYNANIASLSGDRTVGGFFRILTLCSIIGVRFYTHISGSHTIRGSVWHYDNTSVRTYKDVACSGPGYYDAIFNTPITCDTAKLIVSNAVEWYVGMYETSGTSYTAANSSLHPWIGNFQLSWNSLYLGASSGNELRRYSADDARPTTLMTGCAPICPIVVPNFAYFDSDL